MNASFDFERQRLVIANYGFFSHVQRLHITVRQCERESGETVDSTSTAANAFS